MKIREISPFAYQLTRLGFVNYYLVRETGGGGEPSCTLIDTGIPTSANAILNAAHTLKLGEIRRIVLTHAHGDHIGSLDALSQSLGRPGTTGAAVAISHRDARLLPKKPAQDRSLDSNEPQCKVRGSFPGARTAPTHLLSDNELFGSLRCLATPGHTPGHFSLLDERDGTLYAGDALVTIGGHPHVSGWAPWYFPLPNVATWHRPTARASVDRLLTQPPAVALRRIAPGHGPVLEGGPDVLQAALNEAI